MLAGVLQGAKKQREAGGSLQEGNEAACVLTEEQRDYVVETTGETDE